MSDYWKEPDASTTLGLITLLQVLVAQAVPARKNPKPESRIEPRAELR